jgi:hypothetical protein
MCPHTTIYLCPAGGCSSSSADDGRSPPACTPLPPQLPRLGVYYVYNQLENHAGGAVALARLLARHPHPGIKALLSLRRALIEP